jgi:hypothetical protein
MTKPWQCAAMSESNDNVLIDFCEKQHDVGLHLDAGDLTIKLPVSQKRAQHFILDVLKQMYPQNAELIETMQQQVQIGPAESETVQ